MWIMIPARGGSVAVPRKNVRLLGGVPLIVHTIGTALQACDPSRIVVITDDDEIAAVAARKGVRILREPPTTGRATLDEVAMKVAAAILESGADDTDILLTLQPTCPFLKPERIDEAVAAFAAGAGSVITVTDDRHLGWRLDPQGRPEPDYVARVNRQQLPPQFRESGGIIGARLSDLMRHRTRIIEPIRLIEVDKAEALDIDDFTDWVVAEHLISRRTILVRTDASETMGMGHVYRVLAIAQEFARHDITIACDRAKPLGVNFFKATPFRLIEVDGDNGFLEIAGQIQPDLVILDQLDTSRDYVRSLKKTARHVVTFEDLGDGAAEADLLVSDLYKNIDLPDERQITGIANAILAPSFESTPEPAPFRERVERILVVFGGTDPGRLTEKALQGLEACGFSGEVTVVLGPGAAGRSITLESYGLRGEILANVSHMPAVMAQADMAISSAGRTITELLSLGIPVLCLCQNEKELTHTHAAAQFGVINLGLGRHVGVETLAAHIRHFVEAPELRRTLRDRALRETAGRSNAAVIARIRERVGF